MGLLLTPSYGGEAEAQGRSDGAQAPQLGAAQDQAQGGSALQSEFQSLGDESNQKSPHHPLLTPCLVLPGLPKSQKGCLWNVRWE